MSIEFWDKILPVVFIIIAFGGLVVLGLTGH